MMFSKKVKKRLEDRDGQRATVIASNTKFEGTISGQDTIRIAGNFEGDITCEGMLWVEKGGKLKGPVNARWVIIEGEINGDIEATEQIELRSEGRVNGNISAAKIAIAQGCFFNGKAKTLNVKDTPITFMEKRKK
jgi:cytoskeletal protein CcmA (bactofilin family)